MLMPCASLNILLNHWDRVAHICISILTIIGSDNGLAPDRCQAIIWTDAGILLIQTSGTNFSDILSKIHTFSFKKMHFKMSSAKWPAICVSLNELTHEVSAAACTRIEPGHYNNSLQMCQLFRLLSHQQAQCWLHNSCISSTEIKTHLQLTHWPMGDLDSILKVLSSILFYLLVSSDLMIMPSDECHRIYLKISQHWFR